MPALATSPVITRSRPGALASPPMVTEFDDEQGVLQVSHAALAVLAVLATDPTSASLRDHGVAPPLAELRRAGIIGPQGIHPAVAPLAAVMGRPAVRLRSTASDGGGLHRIRAWVGSDLAVVALARSEDDDTYELMGESPAMLPELLAELVGLPASMDAAVRGTRRVDAERLQALLTRGAEVTVGDAADVLGPPVDDAWTTAVTAAAAGTGLRWTVTVSTHQADNPESIDVMDAGVHGLWTAEYDDDGTAVVRSTTAPDVLAVLRHLIASHR